MKRSVISKDMYSHGHSAPVDLLAWRPSAYAVVVCDNNLLTARYDDAFQLPGGRVELGELLEVAVVIEAAEETGLKVRYPHLLTLVDPFLTQV